MSVERPPLARARVYETLRSAHLERLTTFTPAVTIYRRRRYDFDAGLLGKHSVAHLSARAVPTYLVRRRFSQIEINEPVALETVRYAAAAVLGVRLADVIRRQRSSVVVYAIGNIDPRDLPRRTGLKGRLGSTVDVALMKFVWHRCDRIAFGTPDAQATYESTFRRGLDGKATTLIPALPAECRCSEQPDTSTEPQKTLLFLGELSPRKGFDVVIDAWPQISAEDPEYHLTIVGKGKLLEQARDLALHDDRVELIVDPPRSVIHRELAKATVLVLPSRRSPSWKEQVGLPLVEALAHGATVVTSQDTGIADWLGPHGHYVLRDTSSSNLAEAVIAALKNPQPRADVLASLPPVDGREAADRWLFRV